MSSKVTESLLSEVTTNTKENEKVGENEDREQHSGSDISDHENDCGWTEILYGAGDAVFGSVVVAPCVVGVWRGAWGLMDRSPRAFPFAQSFLVGIVIHVCFALGRPYLLARSVGAWRHDSGAGRWLRERLLSRVYHYVFTLGCILHWRGGWGLFDMLVETALPDANDVHRPVLIAFLVTVLLLAAAALRAARNVLAAPYFVVTDGKEATYSFTTRWRKESSRDLAQYALDCIFSVAVVGSLVVFVWRGSWALLDIYLFPDDLAKSYWTSLIGGYVLVAITFLLQAPLRWAAARLHGAARLLLADLYHLLSFLATVNVWRSVWGLLDLYLYPETPRLSNWLTHIGSMGLLMALNCSNSTLVRGVYIDAEEPAGECVVFPCHYLRLFFHKERTKRRHKRALAAAAAAAAKQPEDASLTPLQLPVIEEKV